MTDRVSSKPTNSRNKASKVPSASTNSSKFVAKFTLDKKATSSKLKSQQMPSYEEMQVFALRMGKRLQRKHTDLSIETTMNVVTYAKQLPNDMWSDHIDDVIFKAQMFQHFNFSNASLMQRMYQVAAHQDRNPRLTLEEYADLICLFLSSNKKSKVNFAFNCYDYQGEGYITKPDVQYLVTPMLTMVVDDVDELDENIRFVVNRLFEVIDFDQNGRIEREEFHRIVESDVLMRECFGPCFPDEDFLEIFKRKIVNRTSIDVAGTFRNERRRSLRGPDLSKLKIDIFKKEYGNVHLELP